MYSQLIIKQQNNIMGLGITNGTVFPQILVTVLITLKIIILGHHVRHVKYGVFMLEILNTKLIYLLSQKNPSIWLCPW